MKITLIIGLLISLNTHSQDSEIILRNQEYAEQFLKYALKNKSDRTGMKFKMIPKEKRAIEYAEIILFELYGKENIKSQKPYEIHLINDYWIITGTLPKGMRGGVFELVFDSWNGEVLILEHGR